MREAFSFARRPVPPGPGAYRAVGYALKTFCWLLAAMIVSITIGLALAFLVLAFVVAMMFVGFSSGGGGGLIIGFAMIFLVLLVLAFVSSLVQFTVSVLILRGVSAVFRDWAARMPSARAGAQVIGGVLLLLFLFYFFAHVVMVSASGFEVYADGEVSPEAGLAVFLLIGLVAILLIGVPSLILLVAPSTRSVRRFFEVAPSGPPEHPAGPHSSIHHPGPSIQQAQTPGPHAHNPALSRGQGQTDPGVHPWPCPGCGKTYRLKRVPPVPSLCPPCRGGPA